MVSVCAYLHLEVQLELRERDDPVVNEKARGAPDYQDNGRADDEKLPGGERRRRAGHARPARLEVAGGAGPADVVGGVEVGLALSRAGSAARRAGRAEGAHEALVVAAHEGVRRDIADGGGAGGEEGRGDASCEAVVGHAEVGEGGEGGEGDQVA